MKTENAEKLEKLFKEELGEFVNPYEITNTISKMDNGFDTKSVIDKTKLDEACDIAIRYLNSISLPPYVIAMNAIYRNTVFVAITKAKKLF